MNRSLPAFLIYAGLFFSLTGITARPLMAFILTIVTWLCLRAINRLKEKILFEPLVPSDGVLLGQVFRYPQLYISFVGYRRFILLSLCGIGGLGSLCAWTDSADLSLITRAGLSGILPLMCVALRLFSRFFPVTLDPDADKVRYGVTGLIGLYLAQPKTILPEPSLPAILSHRPHIILIQSESFYDPRHFWPEPYRTIAQEKLSLPAWDRFCREGVSGRLAVPARGANTMRSEYAVLTGLPERALGMHKFNPFLALAQKARRNLSYHTVATALREQGYGTHVIHPYSRAFFRRDLVYPAMGFDHFIDESAFPRHTMRRGPYIADDALAEQMSGILHASKDAHFNFVITMENHGPWLPRRYEEQERQHIIDSFPALPFGMAAYCYHLQGTNNLLHNVMKTYEDCGHPFIIGIYGDHPPSFPDTDMPAPTAFTSYAVWPAKNPCIRDIEAQSLLCTMTGLAQL